MRALVFFPFFPSSSCCPLAPLGAKSESARLFPRSHDKQQQQQANATSLLHSVSYLLRHVAAINLPLCSLILFLFHSLTLALDRAPLLTCAFVFKQRTSQSTRVLCVLCESSNTQAHRSYHRERPTRRPTSGQRAPHYLLSRSLFLCVCV